MYKKVLLVSALALPILFFMGWIANLETNLRGAQEITLRAEGYDPRSLISGHYLSLRINWQKSDCKQFKDKLCHPSRFDSVYKYYLPEDEAQELDVLIARNMVEKIELVFAYPKNKTPHLRSLLLDGQPWKEWFKNR